jgi:flagellar biosynthesis protein FliQ
METLVAESAQVLAAVGAPFLLALLVVGAVIGVLQAATQVNDPAVGAVPRLAVAIGLAVGFGGWIAERLAGLLVSSLTHFTP